MNLKQMMMKKIYVMLGCIWGLVFALYAQEAPVRGVVVTEAGDPIQGASVRLKGINGGTTTDANGSFSISVEDPVQQVLVVSYVGYVTQEVPLAGKREFSITLYEDAKLLEEVEVVVGYGTQKKATLTGSVVSVTNKEIETTKTQNVQNMLTGKLPGVRVVQKTSEPGDFSNEFDIRGFGNPLVIVDGVPRGTLTRIDPNEIESISVLKDAAAAVYGVRAANGVVLITTKRGAPGKAKITYSGYYGNQKAIGLPKPVGVIERYTLMNERSMHNVDGPVLTYNDEDFEPYRNGTLTSTDWYAEVMKSLAPQSQHNLSASGSSRDNDIDYFVNLGYAAQDGYWRSESLKYDRYNLRANLNADITKRLTASLKLSGILENKMNPTKPSWEIFSALWRAQPNEPYYANNTPGYFYQPVFIHPGAYVDDEASGWAKDDNYWLQSQFSLDYKVPYIEGLVARGMFSYDNRFNDNTNFRKEFMGYQYDAASETYLPSSNNGPDQLRRAYSTTPSTLMQLSLNYTKSILETHNISALLLYEEGKGRGDNFFGLRELGIPLPYLFAGVALNQNTNSSIGGIFENAHKAWVGRLNYDFNGKYLAELSFRYDGSSRFPESRRWALFPGGSVGWRISEENFIKNNAWFSFVDNIKLRASYGKVGDDGALSYQFISGYDYPYNGNGQSLPGGHVFDGSFVNSIGFRVAPNPDITWSTSEMTNIGLDVDLWRGQLSVQADVFRRQRSGLLANRLVTVPGSYGTLMPQENLNSDETRGAELAVTHRNRPNDFGYSISGNVALTRTKVIFTERNRAGNSYDNWRNNNVGRYNDVWFGFGYVGQFETYEEIAEHDYSVGRATLPGDFIYEDWNGDGVFDDMDRHPIATSINANSTQVSGGGARRNIPLLTFGLNMGFDYKGFDLNLLFQGGALSYVAYTEQLRQPLGWDGNALDVFMDRWHPVDPTADPYNPATEWVKGYYAYTGSVINENAERNIQNGAYLRLKSAELGYSIPPIWLNTVGIQSLRIFTNAYNLLTITGVKGLDPEHPAELYGYMYPLSRTVNFGASITF